jgi:hypothetical protein
MSRPQIRFGKFDSLLHHIFVQMFPVWEDPEQAVAVDRFILFTESYLA